MIACISDVCARAAHHESADLREPAGGGGSRQHHAGALLLGGHHRQPAPHQTLQIPGRQGVMYGNSFH